MSGLSITPIGTCRINTPLKRGAARYPIRLDLQRIYGFTHTSIEALQQLRYRRGELSFPADVSPMLFRPGDDCGNEPPQSRQADLTIIEISSSKVYRIGDVAVQSNYLVRHFADFFASVPRTRAFWKLATGGDRDSLRAFLAEDRTAASYGEQDRSLLERVSMHLQGYDEIAADMAMLSDVIGKDRILFVTHVNGATPDGNLVPSRDKLIRWVTMAAQRIGVPVFDPTELMREFGQERAMERAGLDLTHFTNSFSDRWYAHVQRHYVLPRIVGTDVEMQDAGASDVALLAESIAAAFEYEDFFTASRQLHAALKAHPDSVALQLQRGAVLSRIGDYEGAARLLSQHVAAPEMTREAMQALARARLETGDAEGALELACQLLSDEYENDEVYEIAGQAADRLGRWDDAQHYRKLAFRLDPGNYASALATLDAYLAQERPDLADAWLQEVLDLMESRTLPRLARAVAEWATVHRNEAAFARAMVALAHADVGSMPALIDEAVRNGLEQALVSEAAAIMNVPGLNEKTLRALRVLGTGWGEQAAALLEDEKFADAYALADAALAVAPNLSTARKVQREISIVLREKMQDAQSDAEVVELFAGAGEAVYGRKQTAFVFARALVALNRHDEALAVLQRLWQQDPGDIDIRANLAHVAHLAKSFRLALELYDGLGQEPAEAIARYDVRIQRFLTRAPSVGIRFLREQVAQERFEEAVAVWRLLGRHILDAEVVKAEAQRIARALRKRLRQLDAEEGDADVLHQTVSMMLALQPDEPSILRRAALDAMQQDNFGQAIDLWQRFEQVSPGIPSTMRNLERCRILSNRQALKKVGQSAASSIAA